MSITVGERRILEDEDWKDTTDDLRDLFRNYSQPSEDFYVARAITLIKGHFERRDMLKEPTHE
jgi:hypothetical protein